MTTVHQADEVAATPLTFVDLEDNHTSDDWSPIMCDAGRESAEEDYSAPGYDSAGNTSPGPPTTYCPPIPIELWRSIFHYVRLHSQHHAAQMPLFCKTLQVEAEAALYSTPHLPSMRAALTFAHTISAASRLGRWVRMISFAPWPDSKAPLYTNRFYGDPNTIDRPPDPRKCRIIGTGLENLRRLTSIVVCDRTALRTIAAVFDKTGIGLLRVTGDPLVLDEPTVAFLKTQRRLEELRLYHHYGEDFEVLGVRRVRVLSCPYRLLSGLDLRQISHLTHLNVTSVMSEGEIAGIIQVLGPQLVSLRLEQNVWKQKGRLYPTNGHAWDKCPLLKFLHVRHCQSHANSMYYLSDDAFDASNLPPALETLVWSAAWTRARTHHLYPDEKKREEIRHFAEAVLRASGSLRSVIYEWSGEAFYKCFLLESGEWREIPTISEEADDEVWTEVR
ncbi:hypothetical protein L226DRAFT_614685 [Lentinus tigrinus ALCF2SS1-7]|uniref:Uncharacterized protein n=1 Tax=Lentinus tigrinus ALCF2SS1-6 TaxID=1328759 RepID=A0A5C2S4S2_9APHY|nr:hypothetical protein L227DRAFT_612650 [Lentinus tigrinus ALCF2SS1-6]RPD72828.1 hypothetical protein L226DRAFT_614685 [Lentinus tigrinus ALCF2SS1-7]